MNKGLAYHAAWDIRLDERPSVEPGPTEVLVLVRATGLCGTDLGIVRGDYSARPGVFIGHESAGEIVRVGAAVRSVAVGDRVVIDPTYHCGLCRMCRTGRPNHCEDKGHREAGVSTDGTFALTYCSDERFVHRLAEHVGFDEASLTEPLSCALTGLAQLRLRADLDTVVVGAGPMGMLYCYALAAQGVCGTVVETAPGRLALCRPILPQGWRADAEPARAPSSLDLIVDTSGHALAWGVDSLRRGGQFLAVGLSGPEFAVRPALLADRSLSLLGSIDSIGTFALASRMIETGVIPAGRLITHRLPLDRYAEAFALVGLDLGLRQRLAEGVSAIKVILTS